MKKFLYSACMMLAVCAAFVSCQKDVVTGHNPAENLYPQKDVEGVYVGEWQCIDKINEDTTYSSGTMLLTAVDSAFCVDVIITANEMELNCSGLNSLTSVANIAKEGENGYVFYNLSTQNGFNEGFVVGNENQPIGFRGRVINDDAMISYTHTYKKSGRGQKQKTFVYSFSGQKQ